MIGALPGHGIAALDRSWWARGLGLMERLPAGAPLTSRRSPNSLAAERLAAWRDAHLLAISGQFRRRLEDAGLTEDDLLLLLDEAPAALAARVQKPPWAQWLEAALATRPSMSHACTTRPSTITQRGGDWQDAFTWPFAPLISAATKVVAERLDSVPATVKVDTTSIIDGFTVQLGQVLRQLATRVLVHELHQGQRSLSTAATPEASREAFYSFVDRVSAPAGLIALIETYPVLARLLASTCQLASESFLELVDRFCADYSLAITELCATDPGALTGIDYGAGDMHQRGRAVMVLRLTGGTVVYKPRPLDVHARFNELIQWLNRAVPALDLAVVDCVCREGYGWQRFVVATPCADEAAVARFYRRQGALLALLHAVNGIDIHLENLIACGDQPMLVDAETLFHPSLAGPAAIQDPAAQVLEDSVQRTGLLPALLVGEHDALDVSGIGGAGGQPYPFEGLTVEEAGTAAMRLVYTRRGVTVADNRPWLAGSMVDPVAYEEHLLDGFGQAYEAIAKGQESFRELASRAASDDVRVIARATRTYADLLADGTHPSLVRDGLDRDRHLDALWSRSLADPARSRLVRAEIADLWSGDIPIFSTRPGNRDLRDSAGRVIPELLSASGLTSAQTKIASFGPADRRTQEWVIKAALATRRDDAAHPVRAGRVSWQLPETTGPNQARCLAAARRVGDLLVASAHHIRDGNTVNWLGFERIEDRHWFVLPLGAGLSNGYCGVALFLAELAVAGGDANYADLARRALTPLPILLDGLAQREDLIVAIGPGNPHGFGGIEAAARRLAVTLDAPELATVATSAAALSVRAAALSVRAAALSVRAAAASDATHEEPITVLARLDDKAVAEFLDDLDRGIAESPTCDDMSLGRGDFALIEALASWAPRHGRAIAAWRARATALLARFETDGPLCATPGGITTPGLCNGLAGIGLGLLRLALPKAVPSPIGLFGGTDE